MSNFKHDDVGDPAARYTVTTFGTKYLPQRNIIGEMRGLTLDLVALHALRHVEHPEPGEHVRITYDRTSEPHNGATVPPAQVLSEMGWRMTKAAMRCPTR